jgi:hypothetical protein
MDEYSASVEWYYKTLKDEAPTALFEDPVRTAQ